MQESHPTASGSVSTGPPVEIRGLTVRAGERTIIDHADAEFPAGAVTLVVGSSGAGKSILLRVLAGLISPTTIGFSLEGSLCIGERDVVASPGRAGASTGVVFQSFALFDELTAEENVLFGLDHRPSPALRPKGPMRRETSRKLLDQLGLGRARSVARLSGGEKQRLAIARALAYDPALIAYDEPTSGLDPRNARRVADLIQTTAKAHGKTTVVVTHDWSHFAPVAARAYLLENGRLRQVPTEDLARWEASPEGLLEEKSREEANAAATSLFRRALEWAQAIFVATGRAVEAFALSIFGLVPRWPSARWGVRLLVHYLGLVASPGACLYFVASGVIAGFVATYFTFKFLPFRAYTEPLLTEELLHGLGFALYRIIVPVLITILLAARCGAAVASDVGTRRYTNATDALASMGAPPPRYLLTGVVHAFLFGAPILVAIAFLSARLTSLLVFSYNHPQEDALFWDGHFHRNLRVPGELFWRGTGWLVSKVLLCGFGVGCVAYFQGMRPKESHTRVHRGITATIIAATLFVLLVHFAYAFLEFE